MKITGKYLLVLIAMCGILASSVGLVTNVSGLFFMPVAEEFGILKGAASLMLTISNIAFAVGGLLVPRLLSEKSLKPLLIVATAVLAGSTAALALCPGIVPMYVLCVLRGLAAGCIGFVFATTVLNKWFVANIGLATSIAMGCSGIAGAVFSPVVGSVISSAGWRTGFLVLAALTVVLNLPALLFLPSIDPQTKGMRALGAADEPAGEGHVTTSVEEAKPVPIKPVVFVAVVVYALMASALTALPQHFPGLAESYALGAALGASMLSACMIANTVGKIVLGVLIDRIGARISMLLYATLIAAALLVMLFLRVPQALLVAAVMFGTCYALGAVGNTMITRDAFGLANYSKTYPVVSLVGSIANAVFSSVVGFMYDFSGGYTSTLMLFVGATVVMALSILFVYAHRA